MLILPIEDARPGMRLAMTVTNPAHPEQELLTAGYALDEIVLAKLRDLGITVLYVDYPDLADIDRHLAPYLTPARRVIYSQIRDTISAVQGDARPTVSFPEYYAATRQLVLSLMRQGKHPLYLEEMMSGLGADGVRHAAAVAHLAMVIGIRMEQYVVKQRRLPPEHAKEVVNLGVAGMLHDLGKAKLPEHLRRYSATDAPNDVADEAAWQEHPHLSFEMIHDGVEASASAAVLHHHQHFDGSGFPYVTVKRGTAEERCEGLRIHVFARILLAADLYARLTIAPSGRRRPTVQILHLMRTRYAGRVDPQVLRVLPSIIPPYPPGAAVKLSDGTRAAVIAFHPRDPYHPMVRRLDGQDWSLTGDPFDLIPGAGPAIVSVCGTPVGDAPIPATHPLSALAGAADSP